jgi:hypothetical protein
MGGIRPVTTPTIGGRRLLGTTGAVGRIGTVYTFLLVALIGGCGLIQDQMDSSRVSLRGIQPTVEQINFAGVAAAQDGLIQALQDQAQLGGQTLSYQDPRWSLVMKAGIQLINGRCDQYLDALFRFNREQRAARQGLTAVGAATSGIMGLTNVAGMPIAIVATAFGLAATLFDAGVTSVLFLVEPSALRNIVIQGRLIYLDGLLQRTHNLADINTRPDVMLGLQGYLTQCSPAAIEANINNAANGSPFAVTQQQVAPGSQAAAAIATGTPAVGLVGQPFALSQTSLQRPPTSPPQQFAPPNRLPSEESLTTAAIIRVQRALGVPATGDPGPQGSPTRQAISEFQRAMPFRDGNWPTEPGGSLAGPQTRSRLITLDPMPAVFRSPFERFLLGNLEAMTVASGTTIKAFTVLDADQMQDLRDRLRLPAQSAGADPWDGVRTALGAKRTELRLPGPEVLDATLYGAIRR